MANRSVPDIHRTNHPLKLAHGTFQIQGDIFGSDIATAAGGQKIDAYH